MGWTCDTPPAPAGMRTEFGYAATRQVMKPRRELRPRLVKNEQRAEDGSVEVVQTVETDVVTLEVPDRLRVTIRIDALPHSRTLTPAEFRKVVEQALEVLCGVG